MPAPFPTSACQRAARLVVEAMEPRLLHSADLLAGAGLATGDTLLQPQLQSLHTSSVQASTPHSQRQELVLIDTGLAGAQQLLADLEQQKAQGRALTIVGFGADDDGLALLSQALAGQQGVAAVHVVSHGSDGVLALGSTRLDANTLMARAGEVAAWSTALAGQADLLLYGCDLAATTTGRALLQDLATLTGADVAASENGTGATALGGDWALEANTGAVESTLAFSAALQMDYQGLLSRLAYDGFANSAGNLNGNNTGSGWATTWASSSSKFTTTSGTISSPTATLPTSGGAVSATIGSNLSTASATRELANAVGQEGSTTWISFLVRPNRTGAGDYMGLEFGSTAANVGYFGYNGTSFILGRAGSVTATTVSGISAQANQPALLVLKLQSVAGADTATLYVNPTPGQPTPATGFSATLATLDFGSFTRLALSAGNGFGANAAVLDEIRVGTSYQDVAPTTAPSTPVITSDGGAAAASITLPETQRAVTTVAAIDGNADTLSYSIVGGTDAARFAINASSGVLSFVAAPDFEAPSDSDTNNSYQVQVRATDGASSDTQLITVNVTDASAVLNVNTFADVLDAADLSSIEALNANVGADGKVSLREAVIAANNTAGTDLITLQAGTYELTIAGLGENQGRAGDLDIRDSLNIVGAGSQNTSITGKGALALFHVIGGDVNVSALTLRDAYSVAGGAAVTLGGGASLTLNQVVASNNQTPFGAGGAILSLGTLNLIDVELRDNSANAMGGGLAHFGDTLNLTRVTLAGNKAGGGGGGAYLDGSGSQSLSNVTVSGNQTSADGGGLNVNSQAQLLNVTLANNNAASGGGLYATDRATAVTVQNTLLSNNGGGNLIQAGTAVTSLGHNVSTDTVAALGQASDRNGANVLLGALANNGGATRTHALLAGSAGVDSGNSAAAPAADQRGVSRLGAADVGAYEYINPANAAPVISSDGGGATASLTRAENASAVTPVTATDADGHALRFSIAGGADAGQFVIDATTGVLSFGTAPDHERPRDANADNTYEVLVQVSDGLLSDSQALRVSVSNITMTARDDSASATGGVQVAIPVLANDIAGEGNQRRLIDATPGAHAASMYINASQVLYTSQAAYSGTDSFSYRAVDGSEGLVHYWNLSGQANDSLAGTDGQLYNGVSTVAGVYGNALHFDGTNDYALINDFSYSNEFTLSFWFRMADNNGSGYRYMVAHGTAATPDSLNVYFIEKDTDTGTGINNVLRTRLLDSNDSDNINGLDVSAVGLANNQWHQYTLTTQAGVGSQVYIDGTLRASTTNGGDAFNPNANLVLGTNSSGSNARYFAGDLDTLQIYNRRVDAVGLYGGNLAEAQVSVTVAPGSGAAPTITSGGGAGTLTLSQAENTTVVTTVVATDPEGATLTYGLVDAADAALFSIDAQSGVLSWRAAPDFETPLDVNRDNIYTVSVTASDGVNVDMQTLNLRVTDVGGPLVVTTTNDTVNGDTTSVEALLANAGADGISLREALLAANASAGADDIRFNLAGSGAHVISLRTALPTLTDRVTLDASSQPGYAGTPLVALDGATFSVNGSGLLLGALPAGSGSATSSSGSVLRGLSIYGFSDSGIEVVSGVGSVLIAGNHLGVDTTGLAAPGNGKWGVDLMGAGTDIVVGGSTAADRNVVGGHLTLGGIAVNNTQRATLVGNLIGLGINGLAPLANHYGVLLVNNVSGTVVGGDTGIGNTIAYSLSSGLSLQSSNGLAAFLGNSYHHNTGLAIDLDFDNQVQPNDAGDADVWQNRLVLSTAESSGGTLHLVGQLDSAAGRAVRIEFYANDAPGAQGHGEGQRWLTHLDTSVPSTGRLLLDQNLALTVPVGQWITATVTQLDGPGGAPLRTSEFSHALQVAAVNLPPHFTTPDGSLGPVTHDVPEGQTVALTASAVDPEGQGLTYTIDGGADASRLLIAADTGVLRFVVAPDFEAPNDANGDGLYELVLKVTDAAGNSDSLALSLRVTDLNDQAPVITAGQQFTLTETSPAATVVGTLTATDADHGTTLQAWTLLSGNTGGAFTLDAASGRLQVANPAALQSATGTRFTLTVQVSDGQQSSATQNVLVDVSNVNNPPRLVRAPGTFTATQGETGSWSLASTFTDPDLGDVLSWSVVRTNGAWPDWLSFNPVDLSLSGRPGAADAANAPTLTLRATVTDHGNLSEQVDFTLVVVDRNDAPQGQDSRISLLEDSTYVLQATDFGFSDPLDGPPDLLAAVHITGVSGPGLLALNGVAVSAGQDITRADLDAGALTYTPPSDTNGRALTVLRFQLQDDGALRRLGSDLASTVNTLAFDVTPVNDAPVVADQTTALDENSAAGTSVLTLTAGDPDAASVLRGFRIVSGNDAGHFELDSATGELRLAPGARLDFETTPAYELGVSVDDGQLTSHVATVSVNLRNVNESPSVGAELGPLSVQQGQAAAIALPATAFTDPDAGDHLRWQLQAATPGANLPAWLTFDAENHTLNMAATQAADVGSLLLLKVTVHDDGGLASETEFLLTVNNVNDAPQGRDAVLTLDEDGFLVLGAADFGFSDTLDNPANNFIAVRLVTLPVVGRLELDGRSLDTATEVSVQELARGALRYLPPANANGSALAQIGFQVRDNGGSAALGQDTDPQVRTLRLDVRPVDDAPVVVSNELNLNDALSATPVIVITDPDTPPEAIRIEVAAVTGGQFMLTGSAGTPAATTSFTLADVLAGQVRFNRDATQAAPGYQLSVADASGGAVASTAAVSGATAVAPPPVATPPVVVPPVETPSVVTPPVATPVAPAAAQPTPEADVPNSATPAAAATVSASNAGTATSATAVAAQAPADSVTATSSVSARLAPAAPAGGDTLMQATGAAAAAVVDTRGITIHLAQPGTGDLSLNLAHRQQALGPLAAVELSLPTLAPLDLTSLSLGSSDPAADVRALINRLDNLRDSLLAGDQARAGELAGGTAMGLSLSVGYVVWLVRGGILASSMLAALPSWQMLDPLPMLGRLGTQRDDDNTDGDQVEDLFSKGPGRPAPAPQATEPAPQEMNEEPAR